jgi:glycosyltransferase involved in cell wall biosynthesis
VDLALFGVAIAARGRPGRTGVEEAAFTVLHLGRRDDERGRLWAVELLAALRRDGQPARLRLVGPVPATQRGRVLARATAAGVVGILDLAGERAPHEVARLLVETALLVVPAGPAAPDLLAAALAGCAAGTPVLAADVPPLRALATEFPQVTLVTADAMDAGWVRAAAAALPIPPTPDERWAALRRLRRSSFCAERPALAEEPG